VLAGRGSPWPLAGQLGLVGLGFAGAPWVPAVAAVVARAMEERGVAGRAGHAEWTVPPGTPALLGEPQVEEFGEPCRRSCS